MTTTTYSAEAPNRAEVKLTALRAKVAAMEASHIDPHYIIGWMQGAITATLIEISVWKEA